MHLEVVQIGEDEEEVVHVLAGTIVGGLAEQVLELGHGLLQEGRSDLSAHVNMQDGHQHYLLHDEALRHQHRGHAGLQDEAGQCLTQVSSTLLPELLLYLVAD